MPLLGTLLSGLFVGLVDFLLQFFTKGVALKIAFGLLFVAGFFTLALAVKVLFVTFSVVMPQVLVDTFSSIFPANTGFCVSAVITTDSLCVGYKLYMLGGGR